VSGLSHASRIPAKVSVAGQVAATLLLGAVQIAASVELTTAGTDAPRLNTPTVLQYVLNDNNTLLLWADGSRMVW